MPTITAVALDRLLEPRSRNPNPNPKPPPVPVRFGREAQKPGNSISENKSVASRPPNAASPILYATPKVTPLPDSPSSFPPSPYIINHKRRGPRLLKSLPQSNVVANESEPSNVDHNSDGELKGEIVEEVRNGSHRELDNGFVEEEAAEKSLSLEVERVVELDDFLDFQESMSATSNTEMDESREERLGKPSTPVGEYYDAFEEISSDGTTRSSSQNIEDELREMRLNLLMEIEKRKQAEEALEDLQSRWQRLCEHLSLVGLTLPALPIISDDGGEHPNISPDEDLCQQVVIARVVSDAIGRACSRAEVEMEMEPLIETKNFEIARLWDRLQYYETANREMSQRNQEAVEMARQQRHQRKRRQIWIWSGIGLVVTLGTAAIAWSYIPASKPSSPTHEADTVTSHRD